jgi:hypothetical protein
MSFLNLSNQNTSYQVISNQGKEENDRERLRRKFKFNSFLFEDLNNSNYYSQQQKINKNYSLNNFSNSNSCYNNINNYNENILSNCQSIKNNNNNISDNDNESCILTDNERNSERKINISNDKITNLINNNNINIINSINNNNNNNLNSINYTTTNNIIYNTNNTNNNFNISNRNNVNNNNNEKDEKTNNNNSSINNSEIIENYSSEETVNNNNNIIDNIKNFTTEISTNNNNTENNKIKENNNNNEDDDYYNIKDDENIENFDINSDEEMENNSIKNKNKIINSKSYSKTNNKNNLNNNNNNNKYLNTHINNVFSLNNLNFNFNKFSSNNNNFNINNNISEVNNYLLDDEHIEFNNRQEYNNCNFKFINDIKTENLNLKNINYEKFINCKGLLNIFYFLYDNFKNLMKINKKFKNLILNILNNKYNYIINDFNRNFSEILKIENYKYINREIIKNNNKNKKINSFSLYLKCLIIPCEYTKKYLDISYEISYEYLINNLNKKTNKNKKNNNNNNKFIQIFKFDIRNNKNFPIWFCSEIDEKNFNKRRLIYTSPILNLTINDYIIFKIDLIENNNCFIENIKFNQLKLEIPHKNYYEKEAYKNDIIYDQMRDCEIENMILCWNDYNNINNKDNFFFNDLNYIKKSFEKNFEIIDIVYDISKLIFIKIKMKAVKIGLINKNRIFNLNIEIVDKNKFIINECIYIATVNTFTNYKKIQIRKGTIITLYITDIKKTNNNNKLK